MDPIKSIEVVLTVEDENISFTDEETEVLMYQLMDKYLKILVKENNEKDARTIIVPYVNISQISYITLS